MSASPKALHLEDKEPYRVILGVYEFRNLVPVSSDDAPGPPLQICAGDGVWVACSAGLPDVLKTLERLCKETEGMQSSVCPEDWGIVANAAGHVTHRAGTNGKVWVVKYLVPQDGYLVETSINISEIAFEPIDPRLAENYSFEHP